MDQERNEQLLAALRNGLSYAEAARKHGVSRQRVHQIARRAGIVGMVKEARLAAVAAVKRPAKGRDPAVFKAAMLSRSARIYGLSVEEYRKLDEQGAVKAFQAQRAVALQRGIEWGMTLAEWWRIWEWSGHWRDRGRGRGKYVMARFDDSGPYAPHNVRIITFTENLQEAMELRLRGRGLPG